MQGLPLFVHFDHVLVLVFGCGSVAQRKVNRLLACGAQVDVISDAVPDHWRPLVTDERWLPWQRPSSASATPNRARVFLSEVNAQIVQDMTDTWLAQYRLVIPCLPDASLNREIAQRSARLGCLVNSVDGSYDGPLRVSFGTVRKLGLVDLVVHARGNPSLAKAIADRCQVIAKQERWDQKGDGLMAVRQYLKKRKMPSSDRSAFLGRIAQRLFRSTKGSVKDI